MEQAKAAVEVSIEEALKASKAATDSILDISPGQAKPSVHYKLVTLFPGYLYCRLIHSSGMQQDMMDIYQRKLLPLAAWCLLFCEGLQSRLKVKQ